MIARKSVYWKMGIIMLVVAGVFVYCGYSKKHSLNIKIDGLEKVVLLSSHSGHLEIVKEEDIRYTIKRINRIKVFLSNELPGERSPVAWMTLYYSNNEEAKVYFYGGMVWYGEELYTTGLLTNWRLNQLFKHFKELKEGAV